MIALLALQLKVPNARAVTSRSPTMAFRLLRTATGSRSGGGFVYARHGREAIGFESQNADILQGLINELANLILTRPLVSSSAAEWIARLVR